MKCHVFRCVHQGWDRRTEGVWFDADCYSEEEAKAQFVEVERSTLKNDDYYPYKAYEYQGELFYEVEYMGVFDENEMPGM